MTKKYVTTRKKTKNAYYKLLNEKKHYILDFDGTLASTTQAHECAFHAVFARFDIDLVYSRVAGLTTDAAVRKLLDDAKIKLGEMEICNLITEKQNLARKLIPQSVEWFEGVPEFFQWSQISGKTLSLVTSASRSTLEVSLQSLPGSPMFSPCITGDDVTVGKPHPEGFLSVIRAARFNVKDCIVFEDSNAGCRAAICAGLDYVRVTPQFWIDIKSKISNGRAMNYD